MVTLIIHREIEKEEKKKLKEKTKMLIGIFYSEYGTNLLRVLSSFDNEVVKLKSFLCIDGECNDDEFEELKNKIKLHNPSINMNCEDIDDLSKYINRKKEFLLRLIQNPYIIEHDNFTELLMAIIHLNEELIARVNIKNIKDKDRIHIINDIERVYKLLSFEWIIYMQYQKNEYPFLFSFAIRTNPFDINAQIEIK